ncbi:unnamed protein product [Lepeophtheirus salmonis]|uniref:(salmon louse) hypothetical protein n=1 Tax=Lepeophtheirus salmonis TaxID=72036 RepID=A0A7R8CSX6_LEPSM|nr:unnamed protein product [Lepeophtheirus salmonis]CAF2921077.1 unnamed protein product [Lepeophtheirus salmonis]
MTVLDTFLAVKKPSIEYPQPRKEITDLTPFQPERDLLWSKNSIPPIEKTQIFGSENTASSAAEHTVAKTKQDRGRRQSYKVNKIDPASDKQPSTLPHNPTSVPELLPTSICSLNGTKERDGQEGSQGTVNEVLKAPSTNNTIFYTN